MKTFNQETKDKYIARVKEHQKADQIIKGQYWENGKGCAVGCTIEGSDHSKYETELGIPKEIAYLEDTLFENLPNELAMTFPLRFLEAVPINADLSKVIAKFVIWQFEDEEHGLKNIKEIQDDKEVYGFCEEVVAIYKRTLTEEVDKDEFYQLYLKIDRARAMAWAGAWAWDWTRAGAWARAWARAGDGAGTWTWAGAEDGAENRFVIMSEKLLELIKECK